MRRFDFAGLGVLVALTVTFSHLPAAAEVAAEAGAAPAPEAGAEHGDHTEGQPLPAGPGTGVAESERLGSGALERLRLFNFTDFEEVSLEEVMGGAPPIRFSINCFGDVSFGVNEVEPAAFSLGQLGLMANANLLDGFGALAEFVLETADGATIVDLERLWLRYQRGIFFAYLGRIHSDIGYWNSAFHHGAWLQPTVDRPRVISFEDEAGLLPVHWTGLTLGMRPKVAGGTLDVRLGIGNGRGHNPDDIRVVDDTNDFKALLLAVRHIGLLPDVEVGLTLVYDRIAAADAAVRTALPDVTIEERIGSAHLVHSGPRFTSIAEGHVAQHVTDDATFTSIGAFALASYRVARRYSPYVRLELGLAPDEPDPFFVPDPTAMGVVLPEDFVESVQGVRIDTSAWSTVKLEHRFTYGLDSGDGAHAFVVNAAFGI